MTVQTMGTTGIDPGPPVAAKNVLAVGDWLKMRWINAVPHPTEVV
jgi:hypothetical protein